MRNPEKSKHLETATMFLNGFAVDFVNLRTEEYTVNSRIPLTTFGTPREDAFRRDLTINALFYNVMTGHVEDYTGVGVRHLVQRLIHTPLPPKVTLLDDPLRLLRAVRFATRLGFTVSDELCRAAVEDDDVKRALQTKVSRDRIGIEFDAMLQLAPASAHKAHSVGVSRGGAREKSRSEGVGGTTDARGSTVVGNGGVPTTANPFAPQNHHRNLLKGPNRAVWLLDALNVADVVLLEPPSMILNTQRHQQQHGEETFDPQGNDAARALPCLRACVGE